MKFKCGPFLFEALACKDGVLLVIKMLLPSGPVWFDDKWYPLGIDLTTILSEAGQWAVQQVREWQKAVDIQLNAFERGTQNES